MKIKVLRKGYVSTSQAIVPDYYEEIETDDISVEFTDEELRIHGLDGFPYSWQMPLKGKLVIKSTKKDFVK